MCVLIKQLLSFTRRSPTVLVCSSPILPGLLFFRGHESRNCKKDDIEDDSQRAKSDRGRARWPDRSAARTTPDVCRTIAHRESDEVMSKSVHVCVPECTCIRVCA